MSGDLSTYAQISRIHQKEYRGLEMNGTTGKDYRRICTKAVHHLGHRFGNPPNNLIERYLKEYAVGQRPRSKAKIRAWLCDAAHWVLANTDEVIGPERAEDTPKRPVKKKYKKPDSFYASWEWKKVRYEALKIHGRRCQCCGWRPGDTDHGWLVVDHIKPRSKYPELELDVSNLQTSCNDCNMGKSNIYEDDFRDVDDWFRNLMRE